MEISTPHLAHLTELVCNASAALGIATHGEDDPELEDESEDVVEECEPRDATVPIFFFFTG